MNKELKNRHEIVLWVGNKVTDVGDVFLESTVRLVAHETCEGFEALLSCLGWVVPSKAVGVPDEAESIGGHPKLRLVLFVNRELAV